MKARAKTSAQIAGGAEVGGKAMAPEGGVMQPLPVTVVTEKIKTIVA